MNCKHCNKPLNIAQYNQNKTLKSCPKCSENDAKQHIYYDFPAAFGVTSFRVSQNSPEGAQSYCTACRGHKEQNLFIKQICEDI